MRGLFLYPALGLSLLPLAALAGAIAEPAILSLWGLSLLFAIFTFEFKLFFAAIIAPMILAAKLAWPVTCVLFPAFAFVYRRRGPLDIAIFAILGAVAGPVLVFALAKLGWPIFISPRSVGSFLRMACASGAILGAIFGYAIWRIDRITNVPALRAANPA
jgi:hypothetical protein